MAFKDSEWEALMDENVPLAGLNFAPYSTTSRDIADWILPEHRIALALNLTQNMGAVQEREGFYRMNEISNDHISVWKNFKNKWILACRATGVGRPGFMTDYADDQVLAGDSAKPVCDLGNVVQAQNVLRELYYREAYLRETDPKALFATRALLVVGYSLGGAVAMCVADVLPFAHVVSFSGGCPPTRPRLFGPGPQRATHYTVAGDLVSSHMAPWAAKVIRVDEGYNEDCGVIGPHLSSIFLRSSGIRGYVSPDEADEAFVGWATKYLSWWNPINWFRNLFTTKTAKIACISPIPGSRRFSSSIQQPCDNNPATIAGQKCRQFFKC